MPAFLNVVVFRGCSRLQMDRADLGTDRWPKTFEASFQFQLNPSQVLQLAFFLIVSPKTTANSVIEIYTKVLLDAF